MCTAATAAVARSSAQPVAINQSTAMRCYGAPVQAPAATAAFANMYGAQDSRMATAKQSINELLGKIEAESKAQGSEGAELASALRQFDGAVRSTNLLQCYC